jgi:hypothetical protein
MSTGLVIFTLIHTAISLVGIASGLVVCVGLLTAKRLDGWTAVFLAGTVATSVTGFMFPFHGFLPSHAFGIVSLLILAISLFARYRRRLIGFWRPTYIITAMFVLYLNVFVLVFQLFLKVPAIHALAPNQNERPFQMSQLAVLIVFVILTLLAIFRFRPSQPQATFAPRTT